MTENSDHFKECRYGSTIITPFNSPVQNLLTPNGSCHIKCPIKLKFNIMPANKVEAFFK